MFHACYYFENRIMMTLEATFLVVEDDFLIAEATCAQLEDLGLAVCGSAASASIAVSLAREHQPSIVLMDLQLEGEEDGVDAALCNLQRFAMPK